MKLARRLANLGTEKAFAVSDEAAALTKRGRKIFPFHIGDLNFDTPVNIVEAAEKAIRDGHTGYCPNQGIEELRLALARDVNRSHGTSYTAENVAIQPGGKPVIGKFLLSLMNPGDGVLYPNPGFPIYESMIAYYDGRPRPYGFREGARNFEIRMEHMTHAIEQGTRLLILNDLHNPTGAEAGERELADIAKLVCKNDMYVLCDESYFSIRYEGRSKSLVSLPGVAERCVMLYTFGKKYAMTGWRIGAALGPKEIIDAITLLNVNHESCTNHFIQYAAIEALTGPQDCCRQMTDELKKRRDGAHAILDGIQGIRCYRPNATFYLYPNVTGAMQRRGIEDCEGFRRQVLADTGVSFCTHLHFGARPPDQTESYIRLAYSGIDLDQIEEGLNRLKEFIER